MSIILKALKKIQEQEAEQGAGRPTGLPSDDASRLAKPSPRATGKASARVGPGSTAFSPTATGRDQPGAYKIGMPAPVARQAFGFGPKALLGLLVIVGIAMVGWFANSLYHVNLGQASETSASETSVVAEALAPVRAVEETPAPGLPAALKPIASVSMAAPSAREENARSAEEVAVYEAAVEPVLRAQARAESAAMAAAVAAAVVPPAEPAERAAPVMKEAEPEKRGRPKFKINAIAWKNKEPRAIVNMQSIYEGDMIEGATVLAIKRKIVVFEYEGETFEIRFGI